jgi:glycosyltransferase involved in cell wall biosynthesis
LESLEKEFEDKGWQMIRNKTNLFPGAARNLAVRQSRGDYVLFMDDDNYAKPNQISTFVQVAKHVGADILTCAMDVFGDHDAPSTNTKLIHRFLPMGAAIGVGIYFNMFGDINALIKKRVYEALNGLTEDRGVGGEDWEFFGRASLKGYRLEAIPLALFWYRDTPRSITKTTNVNQNHLRGIRAYLDAVPPALRANIMLSQAQEQRLQMLTTAHNSLGQLLKRSWQLFASRARHAMSNPRKCIKKLGQCLRKFL